MDYDKAMEMAASHIQHLNETLLLLALEGSVKTTNFNVRTDYDRVKDRNEIIRAFSTVMR